ncbi:uncharacterized protein LAJ45_11011 [Morchella importuna]|uniref:FAD-binding FR-type domain-containing protein n=1 Tax=Morchella conica CCBAS932 TaxID=1392247 RepID=A0A3N4KXN8_9PEZI|nr:uncharacterized protein LAJ45_11011 [Morchella importuna]KAH8144991.1 hypothetical protein LAJ45_11011 [Morchella importuna]RPB15333.1 hypothetical protein P167DRAFT_533134 [Morchella conica CCBAS932]
MLGYTYKDLSQTEKHHRRNALDALGHHVVLSQLAVALCAYVYRRLFCTRQKRGQKGFLRRLEWRLTRPLSWEDPESRSVGDFVVCVGWLVWMLWLVRRDAGDDYLHFTKAFGMAASANFPALILLSMKRSPLRYIFSVSYEGKINYLHQGLAKIIYMLLCTHMALYLKFFWDTSRMKTRLLEFDVMCGVVGFVSMTVLSTLAYPWARTHYYRVFLISHIVLSAVLLPLFYLHVTHLRTYILITASLLIYDRVHRYIGTIPVTATITLPTPSTLHMTLTLPATSRHAPTPVSHLILYIPRITTRLASNPFTVASSAPTSLTIISRVRSTTTKHLATLAADKTLQLPAHIDAFYGDSPSLATLADNFDRVVVIAGGVGGAWAVPWVRHLAREGALERCVFVWAVRSIGDVQWAVESEGTQGRVVAGKVELFVTGEREGEGEEGEEGVEMRDRLLGGWEGREEVMTQVTAWGISRDRVYFERPDVDMLIEDAGKGGRRSVAVLACGPWALGARVRRVVGEKVLRGDAAWVHVEEFAR